ncbi:MAG: hypothetical protein LBR83_09710 [Clostridiales bacterium]|jgi:tRNA A-37 threonylcarbamoyl transferase component Bud32|nr:hypothetical protein [Clostridiales bacterium]
MTGQRIEADGKYFEIAKLLGKGKGGYSYLAKSENGLYVLKKIHYEPCGYYQFESNKLDSELRSYRALREAGVPVPGLLHFNQEEQYLIKEYIDGDMLSDLAACGGVGDSHITQIFGMCRKLYKVGLNIDYFPTNFVLRQGVVYYIDYECSPYSDEWNFENWGIYFLANARGMSDYIKKGGDSTLIENGKPIKRGLEKMVEKWLRLY